MDELNVREKKEAGEEKDGQHYVTTIKLMYATGKKGKTKKSTIICTLADCKCSHLVHSLSYLLQLQLKV